MSIRILLTGGTIDKSYNEANGELFFTDSYIAEILEQGRNRAPVSIQTLMLKDSLDMDESDKQSILDACSQAAEEHVLITHGTDTIVDTAQRLAALQLDKTIVLIGAMVPHTFKHSDATFNVGFALAAAQSKAHGVYVAMNGTVFSADNVIKNRDLGEFQTLT